MTEISMDFSLDEEQQVIADLATSVFGRYGTEDRIMQLDKAGAAFDSELWQQLIDTGLLDAALPSEISGGGLGMVGLAIILEQQGKYLNRVPFVSTAVAASAIAQFSDPSNSILQEIRAGRARVAVALTDPWGGIHAERRSTGWILNGFLPQVYLAGACTHILVLADEAGCRRAFLLPLDREGIEADAFEGMSRNIHAAVDFTSVQVDDGDLLGESTLHGEPALWIRARLLAGLAALESGLCQEAVRRTTQYVSEREQFGRPLSTNQGVTMRAADAYIDTEAIRLTMLDAAWQLDRQGDDALLAALIAAWWAREGGVRVVHAAQHLHGGMGADVENHIHRFFLWARELDIVAGPAPALLEDINVIIAAGGK